MDPLMAPSERVRSDQNGFGPPAFHHGSLPLVMKGAATNNRSSVDADRGRLREAAERTHAADPVPGEAVAGRFALAFVALEEAGDEELLRQRRQPDATGLSVLDQPRRVVEV